MFQKFVDRFTESIIEGVILRVREVINEETADLRAQLLKIGQIRDDVAVIKLGLQDVKARLEAIHPTGEIPVTNAG